MAHSLLDGAFVRAPERTLYIENFGVDDDHDTLRKRLSTFGKVRQLHK